MRILNLLTEAQELALLDSDTAYAAAAAACNAAGDLPYPAREAVLDVALAVRAVGEKGDVRSLCLLGEATDRACRVLA